jgi:hypothetical protein
MTIFMHAREVSWLSTHGVGGGYIDVIHVYIPKLWMLLVWQKFQGNVMSSAEMLCYYTGMVLCMLAAYIHVRLACVHVVGGNGLVSRALPNHGIPKDSLAFIERVRATPKIRGRLSDELSSSCCQTSPADRMCLQRVRPRLKTVEPHNGRCFDDDGPASPAQSLHVRKCAKKAR